MKRIQYWGIGALIFLLIGAVVFWVIRDHAEIQQLKQEASEADKMLIKEKNETHKVENIDSVDSNEVHSGHEEADTEEVSDKDIEKFLRELAAEGKISDEFIETLLEDVAAEEDLGNKTLSSEELAQLESQRKAKELWQKIGKIIQDAGGKIHSATHPEEMQQLFSLIKEAAGGPTVLTDMHNMAMMLQKYVSAEGEIRTADLIKIADYFESDASEFAQMLDPRMAQMYRNLAQYATIKGYEAINFYEMVEKQDEIEKVLREHDESNR